MIVPVNNERDFIRRVFRKFGHLRRVDVFPEQPDGAMRFVAVRTGFFIRTVFAERIACNHTVAVTNKPFGYSAVRIIETGFLLFPQKIGFSVFDFNRLAVLNRVIRKAIHAPYCVKRKCARFLIHIIDNGHTAVAGRFRTQQLTVRAADIFVNRIPVVLDRG